ncbi:MAG TPA: helix-turn-helix domain-containing protein [Jiangellaceae bacterium]|jgi:DNA-binding PucR family transcriptional regulator|nr:helix-turn-helix domain-containing protein [Jiangellaceae bacterium]
MATTHSGVQASARAGSKPQTRVAAEAAARIRTARQLERASGALSTASIARIEERLPWYRAMPPDERSWVGLIIQAGIAAFLEWYRNPDSGRPAVTVDVFGTAPRELTRAITLEQTVEMVRVAIDVVEEAVTDLVEEQDGPAVREAVLRYSREVAFAAAEVYARAAEARGAWDARLEALVVDSLLRGETDEEVRSRAAALGWSAPSGVTAIVGRTPTGETEPVVAAIRRTARLAGYDVLTGVQGDRLFAVLGGVADPEQAASAVASHFGPGPVVAGPLVPDLAAAAASTRAAVSGLRAAGAWPDAPRPVAADALLPERALSGDGHARRALVVDVFEPIARAGPVVIETLAAYLENGSSVEAAARVLFVHPNTVRYRLRRVIELSGLAPTDPRDAYTLRLALTLGRLFPPPTG